MDIVRCLSMREGSTEGFSSPFLRRIRSFVRRDSRMTAGQRQALAEMSPRFQLHLADGMADFPKIFQREALNVFEIGFGVHPADDKGPFYTTEIDVVSPYYCEQYLKPPGCIEK